MSRTVHVIVLFNRGGVCSCLQHLILLSVVLKFYFEMCLLLIVFDSTAFVSGIVALLSACGSVTKAFRTGVDEF